jgi:glycosyltransferase involved in cell wall biosynthesis
LLLETVESCLINQGEIVVEVIVVDDGSSDGSGDQAKQKYPEIKLIKQRNQGACVARNRGLDEASGDFIKFIDSDDVLSEGVLDAQLKHLQKTGADVVYGDFEMFANLEDPRVGGKPVRITGAVEDPVRALLGDWWCASFCYLYRRDVLDGIPWSEDLKCLQDFDFILQVALSGAKFSYQPGVNGFYRMHGGQITNFDARKYAVNRCKVMDRAVRVLIQKGVFSEERKNLIAHGYWSAARAFYQFDKNAFKETVQKVYELSPTFSPEFWGPRSVRLATRYLGIKRAEKLFGLRRSLLKYLKPAS